MFDAHRQNSSHNVSVGANDDRDFPMRRVRLFSQDGDGELFQFMWQ